MNKKRLYFDMDGVIVDFVSALELQEKNGAGNDPQGFEYWQRKMNALDILVEDKGCPLNQIPKRLVEDEVMGVASTKSPAPEFCDFIYEQD